MRSDHGLTRGHGVGRVAGNKVGRSRSGRGVGVSSGRVLGIVGVGNGGEGLLRSVAGERISIHNGRRLVGHVRRLSSLVLGLGDGVNNLVHLGSALRSINMILTGVLSGSIGVDVGEVTLDGMVVLVMLVHTGGKINVSRSGETATTVIARRPSDCGTTANAGLRGRGIRATTKSDASSGRTIIVVLQGSQLIIECSVRLVVRLVAGAVVRLVVRLGVVLNVGLGVVLEVRLGVRCVMRLRVRLIV